MLCSVLKLGLKVLCGVEICVNQITLERVGKNSTNHYGELEGFRRAYLRLTDKLRYHDKPVTASDMRYK